MYKGIWVVAALFFTVVASGCSSLGTMKTANYVERPQENMALINIVRPSIFIGDGVKFEAWNGESFIGTLSAGTMLQYAVAPGKHCIMVDPTQGGPWATMLVEVQPNTTYFIKPNTIPTVGLRLGLADGDDPRITKWASGLTPRVIDQDKTKPIPVAALQEAALYAQQCNMPIADARSH